MMFVNIRLISMFLIIIIHPIFTIYFNNVAEASLEQTFFLSGIIGAIFFVLVIFLRYAANIKYELSIFYSIIVFFFLFYYRLIAGSNHFMNTYWFIIAPLFALIIYWIIVLISKVSKIQMLHIKFLITICFLYSVITIGMAYVNNMGAVHKRAVLSQSVDRQDDKITVAHKVDSDSSHPNVYFIILDAYTRNDTLENVTGFDNSQFYEDLKSLKFNISEDSYATGLDTNVSTGNLMFLEKKFDSNNFSRIDWLAAFNQDIPLFSLFRSKGYEIKGATGFTELQNTQYKKLTNYDLSDIIYTSQEKSNFIDNALHYSIYNYVYNPFIVYYNGFKDFFDNYEKYIYNTNNKPQFLWLHLVLPHHPFLFNENGGLNSIAECRNYSSHYLYVNQIKYLNKVVIGMVKNIIQKDPNSIIVIQSDHSIRIWNLSKEEISHILNAVYYKGEVFNIASLSNLETLQEIIHKMGIK